MAGRGTDIMLGGNAEYMAKDDLSKAGYDDEIIAEASGYGETTNELVLEARALFRQKLAEHKIATDAAAAEVRAAGGDPGTLKFLEFLTYIIRRIIQERAERKGLCT